MLLGQPVEQRQSRASSVSWASQEHSFKWLFPIPAPSRNPAFGSPWQLCCPWGCWGSWLWVSSHCCCATAPRARASFSSTELAQVGKMPSTPNFTVWSGFFQSYTPGTAATWKMHHTLLLLLSIITIKLWERKTWINMPLFYQVFIHLGDFNFLNFILNTSTADEFLSRASFLETRAAAAPEAFRGFLCWWWRRLGIPAPLKQSPHDQSQSAQATAQCQYKNLSFFVKTRTAFY